MSIGNANYYLKRRHWCPLSEKYTGVDSLLDALLLGWVIDKHVQYQEVWHSTRPSVVYYFNLIRGQESVTMPVISNPLIPSIIRKYDLCVETASSTFVVHAH